MACSEDIQQVLSQFWPDLALKPKQKEAISAVYNDNRDVLVNLPTGYGKSIIYQVLSKLLKVRDNRATGSVLVFCPLTIIQVK